MEHHADIELPDDARRRIADDHVLWLTTIADSGAPAPNPVWFVLDRGELVVFSAPTSRKVHNIERRPTVTAHFNSDHEGGDVVVITGTATTRPATTPSTLPSYIAKYEASITGALGMTVEELDRGYDTELRIKPTRVRMT